MRNRCTGPDTGRKPAGRRSEEHTSELQSHSELVCRLLHQKKKSIEMQTAKSDAVKSQKARMRKSLQNAYCQRRTYCGVPSSTCKNRSPAVPRIACRRSTRT